MSLAAPHKKSDLTVRTVSAVVMVAVAGSAVWLGGTAWTTFVMLTAAGVLWEWVKLSRAITHGIVARAAWFVGGLAYIGLAAAVLLGLRDSVRGLESVLIIVGCVIATDVGAYFAGRLIGGPKIAPAISPSKTWAGLAGGICASAALLGADPPHAVAWPYEDGVGPLLVASGALIAVIAQAGDFFESWMKRRAGVKDSGSLIPGHGGLFDRIDGLLAVLFVGGMIMIMVRFL